MTSSIKRIQYVHTINSCHHETDLRSIRGTCEMGIDLLGL